MFKNKGLWHILARNKKTGKAEVSKQGFISYADMSKAANKRYGLNNWTYQWIPAKDTDILS